MRSGKRTSLTIVEMALDLHVLPRTIRSIAELKQYWPSRGSKQWLLRFLPAAFELFCCMLVLAKPMAGAQMVPSTGVLTAMTKEQRLELRRSGLILHRDSPLANRFAFAPERIRQEMTQGCYVAWGDHFGKSHYNENLDG